MRIIVIPLNSLETKFLDMLSDYSLTKITDGDYAGQHWLVSFAL